MRFSRGQIVYSNSGRDIGIFFVVLSTDEKFVYICDGKVHKLDKPKKKNVIHVSSTNKFLSEEDMMTDKKLRIKIREKTETHA